MAGMTRKDFQAIADSVKELDPRKNHVSFFALQDDGRLRQWIETVQEFTRMCRAQNSRFNEARFHTACGYDEDDFKNPDPVETKGTIKARIGKGEKA
ncbi:MAG: hypothetical protein KAI86_12020 [Desulfobacterales bacterium]|nr:hypothetical protein [Desulfobacterales bacterium]